MKRSQRATCLDTAKRLITRHRAAQHGAAEATYRTVAQFWSTYLAARHGVAIDLTAHDALRMMSLLKHGRSAHKPGYADNYFDDAGYIALAFEARPRSAKRGKRC